mmetsp:Transcript_49348/g.81171  ORF Transcript_49348/g.81171 Transcript_49348/m.81171 type:complete len:215 (-) Transcript_49348:45-689(-)
MNAEAASGRLKTATDLSFADMVPSSAAAFSAASAAARSISSISARTACHFLAADRVASSVSASTSLGARSPVVVYMATERGRLQSGDVQAAITAAQAASSPKSNDWPPASGVGSWGTPYSKGAAGRGMSSGLRGSAGATHWGLAAGVWCAGTGASIPNMRGVVVVVVVVVGAVYKALAMGEEMANMASSVRKAANRDTPMRCRRRCWWACPSTW